MRAQVTEERLLIPKGLLEGIDEVEIRKEACILVIVPITATDPIFELGTDPVEGGVRDASMNHDAYLYNS